MSRKQIANNCKQFGISEIRETDRERETDRKKNLTVMWVERSQANEQRKPRT